MTRRDRDSGVRIASRLALGLTLAALVIAARPAMAQTLAVLPPSGSGVSAPIVEQAGRTLLKWLRAGGVPVIAVPGAASGRPFTAQEAAQAAAHAAADGAVLLHVGRLPPQTVLRLRLHDVAGAMSYEETLSTPAGPEALEGLLQGMVYRLMSAPRSGPRGLPVSRAPALVEAGPRRPGRFVVGGHVGTLVPYNTADGSSSLLLLGGVSAGLDLEALVVEVVADSTESHVPAGRGRRALGLSLTLPLGEGAMSVYGAWAMRYAVTQFGGQSARGLVVQPALGLLLGRRTTFSARAEVGYFLDTFAEREIDRLRPGAGGEHRSHGLVFSLGVHAR